MQPLPEWVQRDAKFTYRIVRCGV